MKKIVEIAHDCIKHHKVNQGIYADFTCGNGYDTCFMASLPNTCKVYAFDIQEQAIQETAQKLQDIQKQDLCILIHDGHEHLDQSIKEPIDVGIFNFGYLPQGKTCVTTLLETSKLAVEKALNCLTKHGILILVIYPGHEEGKKEDAYFSDWVKALDSHQYATMSIRMENKKDSPYILMIEKLKMKVKGEIYG